MIKCQQLRKTFGDIAALEEINLDLPLGSIIGLIGSNGSGKSTLLHLMMGIYRPDFGTISYNDHTIYENPAAKENIFFIPDDPYVPNGSTIREIAQFYAEFYPNYDIDRAIKGAQNFDLDPDRKLSTFSKGMQRQAHIILGIAANTQYLFCDETFDGLDPVRRQGVKHILADLIADGNHTVFIASHNLRELEDICDHIAFLHNGKIVFDRDMADINEGIYNVQCAFIEAKAIENFQPLTPLYFENRGRMVKFITRADISLIDKTLAGMNPLYSEILPLTLEEVFITEMEVLGYDVNKLIL